MSGPDILANANALAPEALYRALSAAFQAGEYELLRDTIIGLPAARRADPRVQQYLGLAHRGLLNSAEAVAAFSRALQSKPNDPLLTHSLARAQLESGRDAVAAFDRAAALTPNDASVHLGRAAAQLAANRGEQACADLAAILAVQPGWIEGHQAYARIRAQFEPGEAPLTTLRNAITKNPRTKLLWQALIGVLLGAYDYQAALHAVREARAELGPDADFDQIDAQCLSELGDAQAAQRLFDRLPAPADASAAIAPLRNLIRLGRFDQALELALRDYPGDLSPIWPYRALLWRVMKDPRWHWLEGDERLVQSYDLTADIGPLHELATCLRAIHRGGHQPLDQSVRGGTQTDGHLFARAEPEIRRLREAIAAAVSDYVAHLPPPNPVHPTLSAPRAPLRFAGAWSVRLNGEGYHHDHVHTHGWISSACYIALPDTKADAPQSGWLTLGENRRLLPDLDAFRTIEPVPGKLVLFPSSMWHGTRPFAAGERLTVAFDIARQAG